MSKFSIGDPCQIVRIPGARCEPGLEFVWGMRGTIFALNVESPPGAVGPCHSVALRDGQRVRVSECCLRKFLPEHQVVRWSDSIWRPPGLREGTR